MKIFEKIENEQQFLSSFSFVLTDETQLPFLQKGLTLRQGFEGDLEKGIKNNSNLIKVKKLILRNHKWVLQTFYVLPHEGKQIDSKEQDVQEDDVVQTHEQITQENLDDFPTLNDAKNAKTIAVLNGSTNPELVEIDGKKYVRKKGGSIEHAKSENLACTLYDALGLNVPKSKFYEDADGQFFTLNEYVEGLRKFSKADQDNIKKGFVADCLMGNWDCYINDNTMIDSQGQPLRLDNGGSLMFSATGDLKGNNGRMAFDENVEELNTMMKYNPFTQTISKRELSDQAQEIVTRRDLILSKVEDDVLREILEKRIDKISSLIIKAPINSVGNKAPDSLDEVLKKQQKDFAKNKIVFDQEPMTDKEIDNLIDLFDKSNSYLGDKRSNGWKALEVIGKKRGWAEKPMILDKEHFDFLLEQTDGDDYVMANRGVELDKFVENTMRDKHFYSTVGVYGMGVYSTINERKGNPPPPLSSYSEALNTYAYGNDDNVMSFIAPTKDDNFKIAKSKDLQEELNNLLYDPKLTEYKKALTEAQRESSIANSAYNALYAKIQQSYNQKYDFVQLENEIHTSLSINDDFNTVTQKISPLVTKIGGTVKVDDLEGVMKIEISGEFFNFRKTHSRVFNTYKTKNPEQDALKNFLIKHSVEGIKQKIEEEAKSSNEYKNLEVTNQKVLAAKVDLDSYNDSGHEAPKWAKRVSNLGREGIGLFAAIKGYDAFVEENGNEGNPYLIWFNRSKLIFRNNKD